jgi:hypothetical protein
LDDSAETVKGRMTTLANVLADPDLVSAAALRNCTAVLTNTITENAHTICASETTSALTYAAVAAAQLASASLGSDALIVTQNLTHAMTQLSFVCLSVMAVGQVPSAVSASGLRSISAVVSSATIGTNSFPLPVSGFQDYEGISGDTFSFNTSSIDAARQYGATLSYNPLNVEEGPVVSNASVLALDLALFADPTTTSSRRRSLLQEGATPQLSYEVDLFNREPIDYEFHESSVQRIDCNLFVGTVYSIPVQCPYGITYTVYCPTYRKGYFNVTCPATQHVPMCKVLLNNNQSFVESSFCRVANYSSSFTSCACSHPLSTASALISSLGISHSAQVKLTTSFKVASSPVTVLFIPYETSTARSG